MQLFRFVCGAFGVVLNVLPQDLPPYSYGLDPVSPWPATGIPKGHGKHLVFEHRRELEKSLVVGELKGEVSRLRERLSASEAELVEVKRSCQLSALAEMLTACEEYVAEVRRTK